jgi:hypothetical protein
LTDTTPRHDSLCFADCERTMNPGALPMYDVRRPCMCTGLWPPATDGPEIGWLAVSASGADLQRSVPMSGFGPMFC